MREHKFRVIQGGKSDAGTVTESFSFASFLSTDELIDYSKLNLPVQKPEPTSQPDLSFLSTDETFDFKI